MEKFGLLIDKAIYFLQLLWTQFYDKLLIIGGLLLVYLSPTYEMVFTISFFMLSNLATGIIKTIKTKGVNSVSVNRIVDSLFKLILYVFGLIVLYVLQHHIGKDLINFVYIYATTVSIREVKSIIENIETITKTKIWYFIKQYVYELKNLKVKK